MATNKAYFAFIQEQLSGIAGIEYRAMMGEYLIYYQGKIIGGIYDDRLLVKPTKTAKKLMPDAAAEQPYPGAKDMLLVNELENREFLQRLLDAVAAELPAPQKRHKKT